MSQTVSARWDDLLQTFSWTATIRRVTEVLFRTLARRHLARLDKTRPDRCQERVLRGLIHQARGSRFGRDHDFRRIRSVADYRRLVPSQLPAACLPSSPTVAYRAALRTALALVADVCPRADLFRGVFVMLPQDRLDAPNAAGLLRDRMPALARPYTLAAAAPEALQSGRGGWDAGPTCVIGPAERLVALADQMGVDALPRVWPALAAAIWNGTPEAAALLRQRVGPHVRLLEMVLRPEGPLAIQDPRLGGLRLLTDHGVYFEFLPVGASPSTPRLALGEVETGAVYELLLTSAAGAWSWRLGQGICFDRLDPPMVRLVDLPAPVVAKEVAVPRTDAPAATPSQGPHRPAAGIPAGLPGPMTPTPWSALAGRG
jgi:hypothetical protein